MTAPYQKGERGPIDKTAVLAKPIESLMDSGVHPGCFGCMADGGPHGVHHEDTPDEINDSPESYASDGYGPYAADSPRVGE